MTFQRIAAALLLASLAVVPATFTTPVLADGAQMTRGQCLRIDPANTTERCLYLHRIAVFQERMADTGPTTEPVYEYFDPFMNFPIN